MNDSRIIERAVGARRAQIHAQREEPILGSEFLGDPPVPQEAVRPRPLQPMESTVERAMLTTGRFARQELPHLPGHFGVAVRPSPAVCGASIDALKANLWVRFAEQRRRSILIIGADDGVGASTVAWDLASSFALEDDEVSLIVDADLGGIDKHPRWVGAAAKGTQAGITLEALLRVRGAAARDAGTEADDRLFALPGGAHRVGPLTLFHSDRFQRFLEGAAQVFTSVVIDGPPVSGHPETLVLASRVDGVILVLESERTTRQAASWSKQQIEAAGGIVLGAVLTKRSYRIPRWLYKRL